MFSMKKIAAIVGCVSMALAATACGSANNANGVKEITFQTWNLKNEKYTPYFTSLISEYEKSHPNVKIKWAD
nr:hypothetical protein [Gardnerella vaginalis]